MNVNASGLDLPYAAMPAPTSIGSPSEVPVPCIDSPWTCKGATSAA